MACAASHGRRRRWAAAGSCACVSASDAHQRRGRLASGGCGGGHHPTRPGPFRPGHLLRYPGARPICVCACGRPLASHPIDGYGWVVVVCRYSERRGAVSSWSLARALYHITAAAGSHGPRRLLTRRFACSPRSRADPADRHGSGFPVTIDLEPRRSTTTTRTCSRCGPAQGGPKVVDFRKYSILAGQAQFDRALLFVKQATGTALIGT